MSIQHPDFDRARDKFRFIVECEDLYQSVDIRIDAERWLSLLLNENISEANKIEIRLGLMYMKRIRTTETADEMLAELDRIIVVNEEEENLKIKREIVRGGIILYKSRSYEKAKEIFEHLHEILKYSDRHFLYGLVSKHLGAVYQLLGNYSRSEEAYQNALVTFRRYEHKILYAFSLNDYAVLKKKTCYYTESESLLKMSIKAFVKMGIIGAQIDTYNNLGILCMKTGDWNSSLLYFEKAQSLQYILTGIKNARCSSADDQITRSCDINYEHLMILKRDFATAERLLINSIVTYGLGGTTGRLKALAHEFLGELHTETGEYEVAAKHLQEAYKITEQILPKSDVMTEVRRRQADLCFRQGRYGESRTNALKCINLSKKMGDRYELGAALKILGEYYQVMGQEKKAIACFETAIKTLKSIHECYELMRCCIAYGAFLVEKKNPDAEIYLMDGRQLCKKLELDFYLAKINVLLGKYAADQENFAEARDYMAEAEKIYEKLQPCDQKQLKPLIKETNEIVDQKILRKSVTAAEELKTICRVYEEARFPIEDIKPDLAYQVAQSVGAEGLFLIRRHAKGYRVPLTYNVSVNEAKGIVRRLDRGIKQPLLGIKKDPRIFPVPYKEKSLVCLPCRGPSGFVLCTLVDARSTISPRQFEFLFASAEALERLAEDDTCERPVLTDDFVMEDEEANKVPKHPRGCFKKILTVDPGMIKLIRLAERASLSNASILLEGETGVGKELFAKAIHENSRRKDYPFIAINAGGMSVNFLESQLFGHVKGAYTDAVTDRIGLIEEARGGSVFFDEVGEMREELQVKLLRLLENGEFRRLGENKVRIADIRMISATNRDLLKQVEHGEFRKDLYYRLGAVKLSIPPLRYRTRDIELLIRNFLKDCALKNHQLHRHFQIDVKAMEALELYDWPGNIRELQNEIMRIVSLIGETDIIRFGMLSDSIKNYLKNKNRSEGLLEKSVERYERRLILDALNKNDWNRLRTAEEIGLPRTTLLAKMKRFNIAAK